ncbi:MAG TPA: hypothetical protein PLW75_08310, partial [Hyphomicrobium sp.]|nr:hypothetical protein [Hyphomicrobium sp.]
ATGATVIGVIGICIAPASVAAALTSAGIAPGASVGARAATIAAWCAADVDRKGEDSAHPAARVTRTAETTTAAAFAAAVS